MDLNKIPERSEIPEEFTWDLRDLFPDDESWAQEYRALTACTGQLAAFAGTLGERPGRLLDWLKLNDELAVRLEKLLGYASCKSDQNLADSSALDRRSKATACAVAAAGASAFATPEILAIDDETLEGFFAACPALETYRRPLERIRRMRAHILSAQEETLLAALGEVADGPDTIGSALRNADLRFDDAIDSEGAAHPLSAGTFGPLMESPDRALRKSAFDNCYRRYGELKNTVAATLDAQFKTLRFFASARRYASTLEASLDANEVPVCVYDNLIEAVHLNLDKMYRYVALRKRLLGVDELHMYDVYTPVVPDAAVKIPYGEAKDLVLEARRMGFRIVNVVTNGTLSADLPEADLVLLSLDGDRERHNEIRGDTYDTILANVAAAPAGNVCLYMAINRINRDCVRHVCRLARDTPHVRAVSFNFHTPYPDTAGLALTTEQKRACCADIAAMMDEGAPVFNLRSVLPYVAEGRFPAPCRQCVVVEGGRLSVCGRCIDVPGLCEKCGYFFVAEYTLAFRGRPRIVLDMLRTYTRYV